MIAEHGKLYHGGRNGRRNATIRALQNSIDTTAMANIGFRILPFPKRPSPKLLAELRKIVTAHLSDNMNRLHAIGPEIRPCHKRGSLVGPALTVKVPPGDNLMVHKAIDIARPGDVIVVDAGGVTTQAIIGEIMSNHAASRGVAGMVIDGSIRDAGALAASTFPVYARGVTHRGPYKNGPGEINVPINMGGMPVNPGDIIVGDADGLVAVPQEHAEAILASARAILTKEEGSMKQIRAGTVDRSWVDKALKEKGYKV
jgi:RraA family protein